VRLFASGVAKVLGDLEARVLEAVWALGGPVPARAVYEAIVDDHPVALLTVITVLNKLVDKGILARQKRKDLLHYRAHMDREGFTAHVSRRVVEGILSFSPDAVAASLVDVLAERDPQHLAELADLIQRRLRESERGGRPGGAPSSLSPDSPSHV
jgi:predicted transcriptional regulator